MVASAPQAAAQPFPSKLITIVVPTAPATPPDIISRAIATELSQTEGWKVIVENHPGAVQTIAGADVLKRPADGHAIYALSIPVSAAPALLPNIPFNLESDFAPVIKISTSYNVLVVNPSMPAKSVSDLVALMKREPDKLNFSSGGFGTPAHLIGEMFKLETGVEATHVPYNQFPQAIGDLVSGVNTYQFITILPVVQLIQTGKLRALAVTGPKRVAVLPDVPTLAEAGYPKLTSEDWAGFLIKAGTPPTVVAKLNAAINKTIKSDKVREAFTKLGFDLGGGTPEEFGTMMRAEMARWGAIVKEANIKIQ